MVLNAISTSATAALPDSMSCGGTQHKNKQVHGKMAAAICGSPG